MSDFINEKKIDMKKYRKDFPFFKAIDGIIQKKMLSLYILILRLRHNVLF